MLEQNEEQESSILQSNPQSRTNGIQEVECDSEIVSSPLLKKVMNRMSISSQVEKELQESNKHILIMDQIKSRQSFSFERKKWIRPNDAVATISNFHSKRQIREGILKLKSMSSKVEFLDLVITRRKELEELELKTKIEIAMPLLKRFREKMKQRVGKNSFSVQPREETRTLELHHSQNSNEFGVTKIPQTISQTESQSSSPRLIYSPIKKSRFSVSSVLPEELHASTYTAVAQKDSELELPIERIPMKDRQETSLEKEISEINLRKVLPIRGTFSVSAFAAGRRSTSRHNTIFLPMPKSQSGKLSPRLHHSNSQEFVCNASSADPSEVQNKAIKKVLASFAKKHTTQRTLRGDNEKESPQEYSQFKKKPTFTPTKRSLSIPKNSLVEENILEKELLKFATKNLDSNSYFRNSIFKSRNVKIREIERRAEEKFKKFLKERKHPENFESQNLSKGGNNTKVVFRKIWNNSQSGQHSPNYVHEISLKENHFENMSSDKALQGKVDAIRIDVPISNTKAPVRMKYPNVGITHSKEEPSQIAMMSDLTFEEQKKQIMYRINSISPNQKNPLILQRLKPIKRSESVPRV